MAVEATIASIALITGMKRVGDNRERGKMLGGVLLCIFATFQYAGIVTAVNTDLEVHPGCRWDCSHSGESFPPFPPHSQYIFDIIVYNLGRDSRAP